MATIYTKLLRNVIGSVTIMNVDVDMTRSYANSTKRLFLLDYDGTLTNLMLTPSEAKPTPALLKFLNRLAGDPLNTVVIISGRDHRTLDEWLGSLPVTFVAEHGLLTKKPGQDWCISTDIDTSWKPSIREIMSRYTSQLEGTLIEEKTNSLVWHWRASVDSQQGDKLANKLARELEQVLDTSKLRIMLGSYVIEVCTKGVDKGSAAKCWLDEQHWGFILAAGDDTTDEDLFAAMPPEAFTIKVGPGKTAAKIRVGTPEEMLTLLKSLR